MLAVQSQNFIIDFFHKLEEKDIEYCILRNYEELPYSVGHDIDLFIDYKDGQKLINEIINPIITSLDWNVICTTDSNNNKEEFYILYCYKIQDDDVAALKLDIWTNFIWRGLAWLDTSHILKDRSNYNGFYVASKGTEIAIRAFKDIMGNGKISRKHYKRVIQLSEVHKRSFYHCFYSIYGDYTDVIYQKCLDGDFKGINQIKYKVKKILIRKSAVSFMKYLIYSFLKIPHKIKNFIKPSGMLIAFVGPDGSGKTTIINKESDYLKPLFCSIKKYHIQFGILPQLKTGTGLVSMKGKYKSPSLFTENKSQCLFINKESTDQNTILQNNRNQKAEQRSFISIFASWVVVLYNELEFILGRITIKKIKQKDGLILFDRFFYDFFMQPNTRNLIWPYRRILLAFITKPDIIIHLYADSDVISKRKQELTKEEIDLQNSYLNHLLKDFKNAYTISTFNKTPDEVGVEIFKIIIGCYQSRNLL